MPPTTTVEPVVAAAVTAPSTTIAVEIDGRLETAGALPARLAAHAHAAANHAAGAPTCGCAGPQLVFLRRDDRVSYEVDTCRKRRSSPGWTRTSNISVNSRTLCQLSYRGSLSSGIVATSLRGQGVTSTGTSTSCWGVPSAADGAKAWMTSGPGGAVNVASKVPRPGAPSEAVTVCFESTLLSRTS